MKGFIVSFKVSKTCRCGQVFKANSNRQQQCQGCKHSRTCTRCAVPFVPVGRERVCDVCRTPAFTVPGTIRDRSGDEARQVRINGALKQARKAHKGSEVAHARDLVAYAENAARGREATGETQLQAWGFRFAGSPEPRR